MYRAIEEDVSRLTPRLATDHYMDVQKDEEVQKVHFGRPSKTRRCGLFFRLLPICLTEFPVPMAGRKQNAWGGHDVYAIYVSCA